jgi:hypothetical protein
MSIKNFNNKIGKQTRDLPACSAVTQPTEPPRNPCHASRFRNYYYKIDHGLFLKYSFVNPKGRAEEHQINSVRISEILGHVILLITASKCESSKC